MQNRKLPSIHNTLSQTTDQSLFSTLSPIYALEAPPIPLSTQEMQMTSASLIHSAMHEVLILFYKFNANSDGGKEIHQALGQLKARANLTKTSVNVHILINTRGKVAELFYKENSLFGLEDITSDSFFKLNIRHHATSMFGSLHTKMIVVDQSTALLCGGDPDHDNNLDTHRLETAALIHGPVVSDMRTDFNTLWHKYTGHYLEEYKKTGTPLSRLQLDERIPCFFIAKHENGNPFFYSSSKAPFKIALIQAIALAKTSIRIMTCNLNDPDICKALADACNTKITVQLLTGKYHNDHTEYLWGGTNRAALASIANQLTHDALPYFQVRYKTNDFGHIVNHGDPHALHAKFACIDNELVLIGSSPLDVQSMRYSREADFIFEDRQTALQFEKKFFIDAFNTGYDYFKDAYHSLFIAIEHQSKRITISSDSQLRLDKSSKIDDRLKQATNNSASYIERITSLLAHTLPILSTPTGNSLRMPYSYNMIYYHANKLGLMAILKCLENCPAPAASELNTRPLSASHHTLLHRSNSEPDLRQSMQSLPSLSSSQ